jgi:hypothetical protein
MKISKILTGILFGCSALTSYAAYQFDYGKISAANADHGSSSFAGYADRGGAFGLQNAFYFNTDSSYLYLSFGKQETSFGAYYLDGISKGAGISLVQVGDNQYTAVDAAGNALQFSAGDSIGFWITDSRGRTVYNTPGIEGQHTYNGTALTGGNNYVVAFGEYGQYVNSPNGSFTFDDMFDSAWSVLYVQVSSTAPSVPSGQPLPGVIAALCVGSAAYGGYRARRRRK